MLRIKARIPGRSTILFWRATRNGEESTRSGPHCKTTIKKNSEWNYHSHQTWPLSIRSSDHQQCTVIAIVVQSKPAQQTLTSSTNQVSIWEIRISGYVIAFPTKYSPPLWTSTASSLGLAAAHFSFIVTKWASHSTLLISPSPALPLLLNQDVQGHMMTKIDSHLYWTIEIHHSLGPQTDYVSSHEIP